MAVTGAISALDQALWDLKGKHFECPRLAASRRSGREPRCGRCEWLDMGTTEVVVDAARRAVQRRGLHRPQDPALPGRASPAPPGGPDRRSRRPLCRDPGDRRLAHRSRRRAPPQHDRWATPCCCARELARYRPLFVEDPIPPDSVAALRAIRRQGARPRRRGRAQHDDLGVRRVPGAAAASRYVRPDVGIAGGHHPRQEDLRARRVASTPGIIPHAVPSGPVAVAAHVQLGMCVPNWELQEHVPQDAPGLDGRRGQGGRGARRLPDRTGSARPGDRARRRRAWASTRRSRSISPIPRSARTVPSRSDDRGADETGRATPAGRPCLQRGRQATLCRPGRPRAVGAGRGLPVPRVLRRVGP